MVSRGQEGSLVPPSWIPGSLGSRRFLRSCRTALTTPGLRGTISAFGLGASRKKAGGLYNYCAGRTVNEYYRNEDAFPLQFVKLRETLYLKALRGHDRQ